MIKKLFDNIFEWDRPETKGELLFFRLIEVVIISQILYNIWGWAFYISDLTDVVLPLGIANYIDITLFFENGLSFANAGLLTLFLLIGFTRKWKYSYLLAMLFFHIQYAARFSQGEISHGSNLAGMILLSFGASFAFVKKPEHVFKTAMGIMFFFVGLGYVSAGFSKLVGTGINWSDGDHLRLWIAERGTDKLSQFGTFELNRLQLLILENWWIATVILTTGIVTELTGFLMWFRKTRWIQATLLLGMHIGIVFTMNIYFGDYVYLLILIGFPWYILLDKMWESFIANSSVEKIAAKFVAF